MTRTAVCQSYRTAILVSDHSQEVVRSVCTVQVLLRRSRWTYPAQVPEIVSVTKAAHTTDNVLIRLCCVCESLAFF